jgi:hypothetical protein
MVHNEKAAGLLESETQKELVRINAPITQCQVEFELMLAEIIDQIQDVCPNLRQVASLRKSVAQYGDAYFFYNQSGEFCLLTDFLQDPKEIEAFSM